MAYENNLQEANRCLLCKVPRCKAACPVRTSVPEVMQLYREGRFKEGGKILFDNNPFSAVTAQVCDWHKTCFGHCVLNARKAPIHWYMIEQELSLAYLKKAKIVPGSAAPESGAGSFAVNMKKRIAIIGAGPAGITAAIYLRQLGYEVVIYDREPRIGGVLRYGIPSFRLKKDILDIYEKLIFDSGIGFRGDVFIGGHPSKVVSHSEIDSKPENSCASVDLESLSKEYDAVLIATGAIIPRKLDIPGEKDNPHVIYALDYLADPSIYKLGKKVIVIGGGNVTMDASRTALRSGHDTYVYYRKTFENMPANSEEVKAARDEGVKFVLFEVPVEIRGQVAIVRNCENVVQSDGSLRTKTIEGSEHEVPFDDMIIAVSANVDPSVFGNLRPNLDSKSRVILDEYNRITFQDETENQSPKPPYIFAAGDFVTGPLTVVDAVASAKLAASGLHAFLAGK